MRSNHLLIVACLTLGAGATTSWSAPITEIVTFGDSLSDTGNTFYISKNPLVPFPITYPGGYPPPPYFDGRFSNGPVWVEQLASKLGVPSPEPAFAIPSGTGYATGGATTGNGYSPVPGYSVLVDLQFQPVALVPTLQTQVSRYLGSHTPSPHTLFTISAGANDFFLGQTDASVPAANVVGAVESLIAAGAKHVLVLNQGPLGETPLARLRGLQGLNERAQSFNRILSADLGAIALPPDAFIYQVDFYGLFHKVQGNPAGYGYVDTSNPAILKIQTGADPNGFLFWDYTHPTAPGHSLIANQAYAAVVPEPSTGLLFAPAALGIALAAIYRRRNSVL